MILDGRCGKQKKDDELKRREKAMMEGGVCGMNSEFNEQKQKMIAKGLLAGDVNGGDSSELNKIRKKMVEGLRVGGMNAQFKRLNLGIQQNNNPNPYPLLKRRIGCSVLIVDDPDPNSAIHKLTHIHRLFLQLGCLVQSTTEPSQALRSLKQNMGMPDFVLCNIHMKAMDEATLFQLAGLNDVPVIMMSTYMDTRLVTEGMNHGACSFILKPQTIDDIENISSFLLKKKKCLAWFPWNLHYKFDQVVNELGGLDEAVPEKILELVNLELMNDENIIIPPLQVIEEQLKVRRERRGKIH